MNQNELNSILNLHKLWLNDDPKGQCANLVNANLFGAILQGAILQGANLKDANLYRADLFDANLRGANLRGANLAFANLANATFNKETVFPEGFDPVSRGMKLVEEKESVVEDAAVPAAPKTLHEELSEVLAKHGMVVGKTVTLSINFVG